MGSLLCLYSELRILVLGDLFATLSMIMFSLDVTYCSVILADTLNIDHFNWRSFYLF